MQTVKEILQFIRALLGFLLNLKKKKQDEKKNETVVEPLPPDAGPPLPGGLPGDDGDSGLVGGPYRSGPGLCRSPLDTLGVRTFGRQRPARPLTACLGWGLMMYAAGSGLLKMIAGWL